MTTFETQFVGYDIHGDKVWTAPDNRLFPAVDRKEAEELLSRPPRSFIGGKLGHPREHYIMQWGPIIQEYPNA